jgi:hypothetical protein
MNFLNYNDNALLGVIFDQYADLYNPSLFPLPLLSITSQFSIKVKIGYARVATRDQNLDLQLRALKKLGCKKIYQEKSVAQKQNDPF